MKFALAVSFLLAAPAFANTYVVDAAGGPGSQFTDIATAISSSLSGDVLIVRPGTYATFTLDRGLVLVGGPGVVVSGPMFVIGTQSSERAAAVGFQVSALHVDACAGPVVLQEIYGATSATFHASADVRVRDVPVFVPAGPTTPAYDVDSSRVEVLDSSLVGSSGTAATEGGGAGIQIENGGFAHVLATSSRGGDGFSVNQPNLDAAGGGSGIVTTGSTTRVVGCSLIGGHGAINWYYSTDCSYDAGSGAGIASALSTAYHSGTVVTVYPFSTGFHCIFLPGFPYLGTTHVAVAPDDPMLRVDGSPAQGNLITFRVYGPAGASAGLWLGRSLRVLGTPPTDVESLVTNDRFFFLGTIPASGILNKPFVIPSYLPDGFVFGAQAELIYPSNEVRRTNSSPIVVR